jgi:hypothetical protein
MRGSGMIIDVVVQKPNQKEFKMFILGVGENRNFVINQLNSCPVD